MDVSPVVSAVRIVRRRPSGRTIVVNCTSARCNGVKSPPRTARNRWPSRYRLETNYIPEYLGSLWYYLPIERKYRVEYLRMKLVHRRRFERRWVRYSRSGTPELTVKLTLVFASLSSLACGLSRQQ